MKKKRFRGPGWYDFGGGIVKHIHNLEVDIVKEKEVEGYILHKMIENGGREVLVNPHLMFPDEKDEWIEVDIMWWNKDKKILQRWDWGKKEIVCSK